MIITMVPAALGLGGLPLAYQVDPLWLMMNNSMNSQEAECDDTGL